MLYKFQNNKLMIMDITTSKEFTFNVPGIVEIDFVTANKQRTLIAFTAFDYNHESKGIYICDLIEESIRQIYSKQSYDLVFDTLQERLFFNSGNTINIFDLHSRSSSKLYKFTRINGAPISLSTDVDGCYLSYSKWKSNKQRLFIYDLLENNETELGVSFFNYCWLDNHHIIYAQYSGLSVLNIHTKKSEKIIRDAKSLIKGYGKNSEDAFEIVRFQGADLIVDNIFNPVLCNERIYFQVFLADKNTRHDGIYSISKNKTDLQCHFLSKHGITDYGFLTDRQTLYIFINQNTNKSEPVDSTLIYLRNNQKIDYLRWLPVRVASKPSAFQRR